MTKQQFVVKRSVIAVALTLASSSVVFAQQEAAAPIQKVFVTGSNIKRADKEGSSPVGTLNARQIEQTGANTVAELLRSIPAFGSGTSNDITDGGFSKGKSAVYDLNSIPVSAIERVEIFKDGASAVYGSDAIAGMINFITKTNYKGAEIKASANANDDGEFNRNNVNGVFGFGDLEQDRYNAFFSVDLAQRGRTSARDVSDIKQHMYSDINARLNPYGSYLSAQPFFFREKTPGARDFSTTLKDSAGIVNRLGCDPSQQLVGSRTAHNLSATSILNGRTFCNYDIWNNYEAQSKGNDANLLGKLSFQVTPDITAFTEFGYSRVDREYTGNSPAIASTSPTSVFRANGTVSDYQLVLPAGHPDNPFGTSRAAIGYRYTNVPGGSRNINEAGRLLAGVKGTTSFGKLGGGEIGVAFGGEIRQEKLSLTPDIHTQTQTQTGNILGLANSLVNGERLVKSAFVELRTPFTRNFEMDFVTT